MATRANRTGQLRTDNYSVSLKVCEKLRAERYNRQRAVTDVGLRGFLCSVPALQAMKADLDVLDIAQS